MSLGHVVGKRTAGQNSRGIDGIDIVVWDLAVQKLVDVVAMAESISSRGDMTNQTGTLNKLSKGSGMPDHKVWLNRIFRMGMA